MLWILTAFEDFDETQMEEAEAVQRQLATIAKSRFMSSELHFIYEVQAA